jgi:hypothetical protein
MLFCSGRRDRRWLRNANFAHLKEGLVDEQTTALFGDGWRFV